MVEIVQYPIINSKIIYNIKNKIKDTNTNENDEIIVANKDSLNYIIISFVNNIKIKIDNILKYCNKNDHKYKLLEHTLNYTDKIGNGILLNYYLTEIFNDIEKIYNYGKFILLIIKSDKYNHKKLLNDLNKLLIISPTYKEVAFNYNFLSKIQNIEREFNELVNENYFNRAIFNYIINSIIKTNKEPYYQNDKIKCLLVIIITIIKLNTEDKYFILYENTKKIYYISDKVFNFENTLKLYNRIIYNIDSNNFDNDLDINGTQYDFVKSKIKTEKICEEINKDAQTLCFIYSNNEFKIMLSNIEFNLIIINNEKRTKSDYIIDNEIKKIKNSIE